MVKKLATRNFIVTKLFSDGEKVLKHPVMQHELVSPGTHAAIVERKIRVIKERCRAIINSLPYKLPLKLFKHLIAYVVKRINMLANTSDHAQVHVSPRELFYGRKVDYKRDLSHSFGEFVQAYNPTSFINSMAERTTDGIALYPSGDLAGSIYVYNIKTGRLILRNKVFTIPITEAIKSIIEAIDEKHVNINEFAMDDDAIDADDVDANGEIDDDAAAAIDDVTVTVTNDDIAIDAIVDNNDAVPDVIINDDTVTATATDNIIVDDASADVNATATSTATITDDIIVDDTGADDTDHVVTATRYNLRTIRRPAVHKYAMHISLRKGLALNPTRTLQAATKEIRNIIAYNTLAPLPSNIRAPKQPIPTFIHLTEKFKADGSFDKHKARFIAGGDRQDKTAYNIEDTSSPTVSTTCLFTTIAIAAKEKRHIVSVDYVAAYLEAHMIGEEYVNIDPDTAQIFASMDDDFKKAIRPNGNIVAKLRKALYGCVQSGKAWNNHLDSILTQMGFIRNRYDKCIYNKMIDEKQITIALHVDDMLVTCIDKGIIDMELEKLRKFFKQIKITRGLQHSFLGMLINVDANGIAISMESYIDKILNDCGCKISNPASSPATGNLYVVGAGELLSDKEKFNFHSTVAQCLYLAHRTRPDVLLTTNFLATRVSSPTTVDKDKLIRLLRYLFGTKDRTLNFYPKGNRIEEISTYIDVAFGVHEDAKSRTGSYISVAGCCIRAKSSKQKLVTKDSTEAELVGASDDISEAIRVRNFLIEQGYKMKPITLYQDNQSTIAMLNKGETSGKRNRHINVRYFFITDRVKLGEVSIKYLPTAQMTADMLTKPLQGEVFRYHRRHLLNENGQ